MLKLLQEFINQIGLAVQSWLLFLYFILFFSVLLAWRAGGWPQQALAEAQVTQWRSWTRPSAARRIAVCKTWPWWRSSSTPPSTRTSTPSTTPTSANSTPPIHCRPLCGPASLSLTTTATQIGSGARIETGMTRSWLWPRRVARTLRKDHHGGQEHCLEAEDHGRGAAGGKNVTFKFKSVLGIWINLAPEGTPPILRC